MCTVKRTEKNYCFKSLGSSSVEQLPVTPLRLFLIKIFRALCAVHFSGYGQQTNTHRQKFYFISTDSQQSGNGAVVKSQLMIFLSFLCIDMGCFKKVEVKVYKWI